MIEAKKSRWFAAWFARHCEGRIRRSFDEVHVHGLDVLRATTTPVLIVSNHTAWWDPVVAIWLTQRLLRLDSYAMMNGANLRRLPFFAKIGAFGVDLEDPSDGARSLRYAARLLRDGRRTVWIFAQGTNVRSPSRSRSDLAARSSRGSLPAASSCPWPSGTRWATWSGRASTCRSGRRCPAPTARGTKPRSEPS